MITEITPKRKIFRHAQDTGTNCGRACAQMVVSSLAQSPPSASGGAAPPPTTPIVVDQATLKSREHFTTDVPSTDSWYTHPDELVKILHDSNEIPPSLHRLKWRVANHGSLPGVLAEVVLAMQRGMPSIINVKSSDHWVTVAGVGQDNGQVEFFKLFDPQPLREAGHTYVDGCTAKDNGSTYGRPIPVTPDEFGGLNLEIGTTPTPNGLTNYAGRFVAVVHGSPSRRSLQQAISRIDTRTHAPTNVSTATDALMRELRHKADQWNVVPLQRLLGAGVVPVARVVRDIEGSAGEYALLSLFDTEVGYGVIAAFNPAGPTLMHFQITTNARIGGALQESDTPTLWWTRGRLPTLNSPYYPFRLKAAANGVWEYERLFDKHPLKTGVAPRV